MPVIKRLLKAGAQVSSDDDIGETPLSYAICNGDADVPKLFFREGTLADSEDVNAPIYMAPSKYVALPYWSRLVIIIMTKRKTIASKMPNS